jgi:hypothetical protein
MTISVLRSGGGHIGGHLDFETRITSKHVKMSSKCSHPANSVLQYTKYMKTRLQICYIHIGMIFLCRYLQFWGVILNREIYLFGVIFRLGTTRHSISHTRKLLKPMRHQNGIGSYRGSLFLCTISQIGNRLICIPQ